LGPGDSAAVVSHVRNWREARLVEYFKFSDEKKKLSGKRCVGKAPERAETEGEFVEVVQTPHTRKGCSLRQIEVGALRASDEIRNLELREGIIV
jgi:hypothetical protein